MGITVEINSLEEMCDMMCDNKLPEPEEGWWIFTFGQGQKYTGYYVKIWGTYESARNKMFQKYGNEWAFQYSLEEWDKWKNNTSKYWEMEEQLEVIE